MRYTQPSLISMKFGRSAKIIATLFIVLMIADVAAPTAALAITGHDSMPEYRSFEPVATTNMVNLFNGSLTYNIPLMNVPGGYPINLAYHSSEITNEALSSWVGLGWNINPGTINRIKKGFPDEFNGQKVTYHNRMPKNWTVGLNVGGGAELFSWGLLSLGSNYAIRYNNYNGLGTSITGSLGIAGVSNLSASMNNGVYGFDAEVRPGNIFNTVMGAISAAKRKKTEAARIEDKQCEDCKDANGEYDPAKVLAWSKEYIKMEKQKPQIKTSQQLLNGLKGSNFSTVSNTSRSYPATASPYQGAIVELQFDAGVNFLPVPIDLEASVGGSFTIQKIKEESVDKTVYGYLHSENALDDPESMMDYTTENENQFEKRDNVLGYPLPNNDQYNMSGEAMGGSFRAYRNDVGHYRKDKSVSEDFQVNASADVNLASVVAIPPMTSNFEYTLGSEIGGAYHRTEVKAWEGDDSEYDDFQFRSDDDFPNSGEKFSWRFNMDKAGFADNSIEATYTNSNSNIEAIRAQLDGDDFELPWQTGQDNYFDPVQRHENQRNKRSTYILQHLNAEFGVQNQNANRYKVYEKNTHLIDWSIYASGSGNYLTPYDHSSRDSESPGEFVSYNNDGVTYVYGLPVYAKNDKQLQYDFPGGDGLAGGTGYDDKIISEVTSTNADADYKRKVGTESESEYATTHLITQILGDDYIDRTGNGPSSDDFGTFTKFNYYKVAGGNDWYNFRTPYTGVSVEAGSLSSRADDMGGYTYGEKEVYMLHSVVSKTHVAIFTLTDRDDGLGAQLDDNPSAEDALKGTKSGAIPNELKKLSRIDLYNIKDCQLPTGLNEDQGIWEPVPGARPIKTVHFKYDYSLCNGAPNSSSGKLTLKQVYFESGGMIKARISPYEFSYDYFNPPAASTNPYNNPMYADLEASTYGSLAGSAQNPDYAAVNTDRWGNYRDYSTMANTSTSEHHLGRLARYWPFVHQNPNPATFDPAAFCLKQIKLPSGGEIHIQYEQADYAHVQDQRAMLMVPLSDLTSASESGAAADEKMYYLDLEKVGIDFAALTPLEQATLLEDMFGPMVNGKRMFFNMLYAIIGSTPDPDFTHSDYVEGYARINGYGIDPNDKPYFTFKGSGTGQFYPIQYNGNETSRREFPNKVCKEFYKSQRRLKIDGGSNATTLEDAVLNNDGKAVADAFLNVMERILDAVDDKCSAIEPTLSYVRLQVPAGQYRNTGASAKYYSKLGGGFRVKRLLSYDPGLDANYTAAGKDRGVLYGNEYVYTTLLDPLNQNTVISSGVATNEPASGRRESALVNPIDKNSQSNAHAFFYGRDMYGLEGPLGESVLPGPSIGYSKVTIKPIYRQSNALGSEEHEFYTVKEFPNRAEKTIVQQTKTTPISVSASLFNVSLSYERDRPNMAQGYHFIDYNMHGKPKSIKKYGQGMEGAPYYMEFYEYHHLNEYVKLMGEDMRTTQVQMKDLGRASEVLFESRRVWDFGANAKVGVDVTTGIFTIPTAPFILSFTYPANVTLGGGASETIFDSHVTTKLTSYPALLKRTVKVQEGIAHYSENMAFDEHSGDPVVIRSYDEFYNQNDPLVDPANTGVILAQDFRASWKYDNFKSKFSNENLYVDGSISYSTSGAGATLKEFLTFSSSNNASCSELANFVRGDFIEINDAGSNKSLYHIDNVDFNLNRLYIRSSQHSDGPPFGSIDGVTVLRSGYNNRLNNNIGNIKLFERGGDPNMVSWTDNLDADHPLVAELNSNGAINSLSPGNSTSTTITMNTNDPNYSNLNLAAYSTQIQTGCPTADPTNLEVTDITMLIDYASNGELIMTIQSFVILCNGNPVTINCP